MVKPRALWFTCASAILGCLGAAVFAQAPSGPTFEVASVKPNHSGALGRRFGLPANRFEATNIPLKDLIAFAYGEPGPPPEMRPDYQVTGGPDWKNTDMFDVVGTTGSDVPLGPAGIEQKMLMLRTLLAERFKLSIHHEARDAPIYALVLANRDGRLGPQLHRSEVDCNALFARAAANAPTPTPPAPGQRSPCRIGVGLGTITISSQSIATAARLLSRLMDRPVLDRTGLSGAFDLDLSFDPGGLPGLPPPPPGADRPPSDAPSVFTAVQEQLGLKLESTKGPVDVLVIDHVDHPTEN